MNVYLIPFLVYGALILFSLVGLVWLWWDGGAIDRRVAADVDAALAESAEVDAWLQSARPEVEIDALGKWVRR